ncbi:MAG: helix-turn-helix transcriptional regulator [Eubacterium sp.]|nr:helix-turn-helix transcriptional regulator [Eubacterium sp.]
MEKFNIDLGNKITALREAAGQTQSEIAELLGYKSHQQVSYLENGQRSLNVQQIAILAKHFNVSADYLIGLSEAKTTDKDLQYICDYTGLDENAINVIRKHCIFNARVEPISDIELGNRDTLYLLKSTDRLKDTVNEFINSTAFTSIIDNISHIKYVDCYAALITGLLFEDYDFANKFTDIDSGDKEKDICETINSICELHEYNKYSVFDNEKDLTMLNVYRVLLNYFEKQTPMLNAVDKHATFKMLDIVMYALISANKSYENINDIDNELTALKKQSRSKEMFNAAYNAFKEVINNE